MRKFVLLCAACVTLLTAVSNAADEQDSLERPYAPLMAPMGPGTVGPEATDETIEYIAKTYTMINSHGGMADATQPDEGLMAYWAGPSNGLEDGLTVGQRIKKINPSFLLSNYRNGSYIQQNCPGEAAEVEKGFPLGIAVWNTRAKLANDIDADATELSVVAPSELPKNSSDIYPFKTSTTDGAHSKSPKEYVAWLRIGDEILRIDKAAKSDDGYINLTVQRGYWNTSASKHSSKELILMPVYIGSVTAGGDVALSGVPDNKSPQLGIRYALQQQNESYHKWLAEKCRKIFDEGYDVTWLDVATSAMYNNGDAYGNVITPWDLPREQELTAENYCKYQQIKFDAMFKAFPDKMFYVNNIKGSAYFVKGFERRLLSGEGGHHPVSGGAMENYAICKDEADWKQVAEMILDYIKSDFDGVAWSKTQEPMREYHLFAYATYLLGWKPGSGLMFGGQWIRDNSKPEEFFYYDLGEPVQTYGTIEEAAMADAKGIYSRDFAKAKVLVNPTNKKIEDIKLSEELFDPAQKKKVKSVSLEPMSGMILLKPFPEN